MCQPQIYKGDPRTCAIFILAWGSNWGYSGFSRDQNNYDLSGAYVLWSEREDKPAWKAARYSKIVGRIFVCIWFHVCGRQKPEYPQFEPHGWRRQYTGWYTRSGISLCICRVNNRVIVATALKYQHSVAAYVQPCQGKACQRPYLALGFHKWMNKSHALPFFWSSALLIMSLLATLFLNSWAKRAVLMVSKLPPG